MVRKPRIHYDGAIYHMMVRGNNKENVFYDYEDHKKYYDLIKKYKNKYEFFLYAYILMDNHVHLLLQVNATPLSKIMQGIQLSYTQYFNRKYKRVGHVFQQRYKAELCDNKSYLLTLIRYIHGNRVKAKLSDTYAYEWSSHKDYIHNCSDIIDLTFPLNMFDTNRQAAISKYIEFINSEDEILINDQIEQIQNIVRCTEESQKSFPITLQELVKQISKNTKVSEAEILMKTKKQEIVQARKLVIYMALKMNMSTRKQIADYFHISPSNVTKAYNNFTETEFSKEIEKNIESQV